MLRPATHADLPSLTSLDARTNPSPWSIHHFTDAFNSPYSHIWLIQQANQTIAFAVWQTILEETELHLIVTTPEYRRQGIASQLLQHICQSHTKRIFLEVRASNSAAQAFYHSHGFHKIGTRKGYYQSEDAIIMERTVLHHG